MDTVKLSRCLQTRRSSINCLSPAAQVDVVRCKEKTVKAWSSLENLVSPENSQKTKERLKERKTKEELKKNHMIIVNVGGKVFHIPTKCALKYPKTRIGSLVQCQDKATMFKLCDDYSVHKNEFFFDRDPAFFHSICHFYTSGVLWVSQEMCPVHFEEEVGYWGLSLRDTKFCCWLMFEEKLGDVKDRLKVEKELLAELEVKYDDEHFKDMKFGEARQILWNLVENPYSSTCAKAFTIFSNMCVLISIVAIALDTVEELQIHKINGKTHMEWVEVFTIFFFTFEYLLRFASTPDLKMFVTSTLNFVDLVAIVPYFVQIIFEGLSGVENIDTRQDLKTMAQVGKLSNVLKVVKLLRIFRILKLARHSTGMKAFGFTLKQCSQEVCCIFLFIGLGIFTFSALLHSVERETEGSPISSIPYAWWWAAVSISTVGYGDVVPVTILGRFVAFGCISFGIILNGMPISCLFNNFSDYYGKLKAQEYNITSVQRRFGLRTRLRRKCDYCFHPAMQNDPDSPNNNS